eukprot:scaffold26118_cov29-Tisochrysis_lutea.AAC.4
MHMSPRMEPQQKEAEQARDGVHDAVQRTAKGVLLNVQIEHRPTAGAAGAFERLLHEERHHRGERRHFP